MLKKLQEKAGYVSVETVIVAGLLIALGVFAVNEFNLASREVVAKSTDDVFKATFVNIGNEDPIL